MTTLADTNTTSPLRLDLSGMDQPFGDFRDDLARYGYAVVRGAIPADRAAGYVNAMHDWLESFNLGYKRDDPNTIKKDLLPVINEKGMCINYGICHESFVWDIRSEPGVISAFEKVYGTEDLIVSFDAVNVTFPKCLQGLVNLLPNGPDDGGLMVCEKAYLLSEEFHREFADEVKIPAWTPEWYGFTPAGLDWLKSKGCVWTKVTAGPGDLIVWDSRAPHYNVSPTGSLARFATYTCYMPVSDATTEDLIKKKEAFESGRGTTHWPNAMHVGNNVAIRDGQPDPIQRLQPWKRAVLGPRAYKLTGIPYLAKAVVAV